jgi:hypothetical protein
MVSRYIAGTHTPDDYHVRRRAYDARRIPLDAWDKYPPVDGAQDGARCEVVQEDRAHSDRTCGASGVGKWEVTP